MDGKPGDGRQTPLLFDRDAHKFRVLDAIDPSRLPAIDGKPWTRRRWSPVKAFIRAIELCSGRDGCHARVSIIAAKMPASERGAQNARALATRMGFVVVSERPGRTNRTHVNWDALLPFCPRETLDALIDARGAAKTPRGAANAPWGAADAPQETFLKRELKQPPPSSPVASVTEHVDASTQDWGAVVELLREAGLTEELAAIAFAKSRGLSPGYVAQLCAFFTEHRAGFQTAGALHYALRNGVEGREPRDSFPPFEDAYARSLRTRERLGRRPAIVDDAPNGPTLEELCGEQLDCMTREDRNELAMTLNPIGQREYRSQRDAAKLDGLARTFMLNAMQKRDPSRAEMPALK